MEVPQKLETKFYRLERLCKWEHITEVNEMLTAGVSPHTVSDWCKEHGFSISHPKLYEYRDILKEAVTKQVTVERLLGIGVPKRSAIVLQSLGLQEAKNLVRNEMEVLDGIIQRGFTALLQNPEVKVADAMKAIELKHKITGGGHGGLTTYGLDQLRNLEQAKFNAIIEVVMKYLPEDKYEELSDAIAIAERKYYETEAPEYLEQYEQSMQEQMDEDNEYREDMEKGLPDDPQEIVYTDF